MGTAKRRSPKTATVQVNGLDGAAANSDADEQRRQEERELDKRIRQYLGKGSKDYDPKHWVTIREHLRLRLLYPGKHIVFRDRWEGRGDTLRLLEVKPLLITDDPVEASTFLTKLVAATPPHEQPYLGLTCTDPPPLIKLRCRKPSKGKRGK